MGLMIQGYLTRSGTNCKLIENNTRRETFMIWGSFVRERL